MEMETKHLTIKEIINLFKNQMLRANPEYQRGEVWSSVQKKKLIDSVFRGYPLPLIYLHHIKRVVAAMKREDLEIIDGQQRITALYEFSEGGYPLLDPAKDSTVAKFPKFVRDQPCAWASKEFRALPKQLQNQFLNTKLSVAQIKTNDDNEVRDLFVRLQSGLPLNSQETRDAWPGQFTEFVLRVGGKPKLARYPGHPIFQKLMGMNPDADRGKTRQLAAQIAMLYFGRRENGMDHYTDINSAEIDNFYYSHIDFDQETADAKRLIAILDKIVELLGDGKRPKLRAHDIIHLVLLVDSLWDEYTRSWEKSLPKALDKFQAAVAKAKATRDSNRPDEFWLRYGQWTRVNSDRRDTIRQRHEFYLLKKCGADVAWVESEIHHVKQHSSGGATVLKNGVLVHKHCHPKGALAKMLETSMEKTAARRPKRSMAAQ